SAPRALVPGSPCLATLRSLRRDGQARRQPIGELTAPRIPQTQSEFGAAPQDVVGAHGPFVLDEVGNFALVQACTEMQAWGGAVAGKDLSRQGAVAARQPLRRCLVEHWMGCAE